MSMYVLVTGGAGYVGSNIVRSLIDAGHRVCVIDDLSSGHRAALPTEVELIVGSCGDRASLDAVPQQPDGVMHMAAKCSVAESLQQPRTYYNVNLSQSIALLDWMVDRNVGWIIHSSTAAVYGTPGHMPVNESTETQPINAYGATKLAVDHAINYYAAAYGLRGVSLRYFNAAGARPDGSLGEDKTPASNLVLQVLAVAMGKSDAVEVYGSNYDSIDGTATRDYVHVVDLAAAHLAALQGIASINGSAVYNLGTGTGSTVMQVIKAARCVTNHPIPVRTAANRPGDPPALIASSAKAHDELGWAPEHSDLMTILRDAWAWHQSHPSGYASDADQQTRESR